VSILIKFIKKNKNTYLKKKEKKKKEKRKTGSKGWPGRPQPMGVAARHPRWPPLAALFFVLFCFFLILIFFKKNKFIYLFFNKFIFFIKMDTCRHFIIDTWR
jgi:hypothetical protein